MTVSLLEIGAVARDLGVAPSTLRSWERRYRIVIPQRGSNGQRLYDSDQVVLLRQVLAQVRRGVRAGVAHHALEADPGAVKATQLRLQPTTDAPLAARRAVDDLVGDEMDDRFAFNLRLIVSELVKNAVVHGPGDEPVEVELRLYPDSADLKVRNGGRRLRLPSLRSRSQHGGLGLEIVDALATAWTIDSSPRGTCVTVRLDATSSNATVPNAAASRGRSPGNRSALTV